VWYFFVCHYWILRLFWKCGIFLFFIIGFWNCSGSVVFFCFSLFENVHASP
jgi:hypothetical protein